MQVKKLKYTILSLLLLMKYYVRRKANRINWFVVSYGISTLVGYLMSNTIYTFILNIYDL